MEPNWNESRLSPDHLDRMILRNILPVVMWVAIGLVVGFIYLVIAQPRYTAQTALLLETETGLIGDVETLYLDLDTHARLIRTEGIVAEVIRRLELQNDPRFDANEGTIQSALNFSRDRLSQPLLGKVRHLDTADLDPQARTASIRDDILARVPSVVDDLAVLRQGETRLLQLNFSSDDPVLSATVANTFAEVYVEHLRRIGDRNAPDETLNVSETDPSDQADGNERKLTVSFTKEDAFTTVRAGLFDDLRIVSRATVPTSHSTPNIALVLASFGLIGLFIGLLRAARREWRLSA